MDGLKIGVEVKLAARTIIIGGVIINASAPVHLKDNKTLMVPVRAIAEHMVGAQNIGWDKDKQQVTVTVGAKKAIMHLNHKLLTLEDTLTGSFEQKTMEVAPYERDGVTFLPFRVLGEEILGLPRENISWDENTKTAYFNNIK